MTGRILIYVGIACILIGLFLLYGHKVDWLGKLPGDVYVKRENFSFYFPLTTSIVISLLISLIIYLIRLLR